MAPLDDEQETPEKTLCIHEHGLPHVLCPYPCPYVNYQMPSYLDSLDLSDILDYEDYMVTSSNEDIPASRIHFIEIFSGLIRTLYDFFN